MNYTANIRTIVKSILPKKLAYGTFEYITLVLVKYYEWKLGQKIYLRKNTSDFKVFAELFMFRDYNYKLPFTPKTIIDAGANVGYSSLWFHSKFPSAHIVAIEPELSNFELLKKNTKKIKNILLLKKGLWPKTTKLEIINEDGNKYGFITKEAPNSKDGIETCTIAEIHEHFKSKGFDEIDILKIDIEGAEKEVFSENYSAWLGKVKIIIIELHEESSPGCTKAFMDAIDQYNFKLLIEKGENLVYIKK